MSTIQAQYQEACASTLSSIVLRTLAQNIKTRVDELSKMGEDDLVAEFHRVLQLPGQPQKLAQQGAFPGGMPGQTTAGGIPPFQGQMPGQGMPPQAPFSAMPGGMPGQQMPGQGFQNQGMPSMPQFASASGHLAPAFGGGAFPAPGMMNGFGAPTTKRGKKPEPLNLSVQEFAVLRQQGQRVCAYCSTRGAAKGRVCCLQPVKNMHEQDPLNLRCDAHEKNQGNIRVMLGGAATTGVMPQAHPGFNMPPNGFPGQQMPPAPFGAFPGQGGPGQMPGGMPGQQMPGGMPGQGAPQAPTFKAERHQYLPEKYAIGEQDIAGWLFYNNPPEPIVAIGKFAGTVPAGYQFQQDWPNLVQPLSDADRQKVAQIGGLKYAYKHSLGGAPPTPGPGQQQPQQQMPGGMPPFPGQQQPQQMPFPGQNAPGQQSQQQMPFPGQNAPGQQSQQQLPNLGGAPQPIGLPGFQQLPSQQQPTGLPAFPGQNAPQQQPTGLPAFPGQQPQQQAPQTPFGAMPGQQPQQMPGQFNPSLPPQTANMPPPPSHQLPQVGGMPAQQLTQATNMPPPPSHQLPQVGGTPNKMNGMPPMTASPNVAASAVVPPVGSLPDSQLTPAVNMPPQPQVPVAEAASPVETINA